MAQHDVFSIVNPRIPSIASSSSNDFDIPTLSAGCFMMNGTCVCPTNNACSNRVHSDRHASFGFSM